LTGYELSEFWKNRSRDNIPRNTGKKSATKELFCRYLGKRQKTVLTLATYLNAGGTVGLLATKLPVALHLPESVSEGTTISELFGQAVERWRALTNCFSRQLDILGRSGPNGLRVARTKSDRSTDQTPPVEVGTTKIRIEAGGEDLVESWSRELNCRSREVLETLRAEGIWIEAFFLERDSEGTWLIAYLKGKDLKRAAAIARRSEAPIDHYHREFKESAWREVYRLQRLVSEELSAHTRKGLKPSRVRCFKVDVDSDVERDLRRLSQAQRNAVSRIMKEHDLLGLSLFLETRHTRSPVLWIFQHQMGSSDRDSVGREMIQSLLSRDTVGRWDETELSPLLHFENKKFDD
jgi:hypothetical protein